MRKLTVLLMVLALSVGCVHIPVPDTVRHDFVTVSS